MDSLENNPEFKKRSFTRRAMKYLMLVLPLLAACDVNNMQAPTVPKSAHEVVVTPTETPEPLETPTPYVWPGVYVKDWLGDQEDPEMFKDSFPE